MTNPQTTPFGSFQQVGGVADTSPQFQRLRTPLTQPFGTPQIQRSDQTRTTTTQQQRYLIENEGESSTVGKTGRSNNSTRGKGVQLNPRQLFFANMNLNNFDKLYTDKSIYYVSNEINKEMMNKVNSFLRTYRCKYNPMYIPNDESIKSSYIVFIEKDDKENDILTIVITLNETPMNLMNSDYISSDDTEDILLEVKDICTNIDMSINRDFRLSSISRMIDQIEKKYFQKKNKKKDIIMISMKSKLSKQEKLNSTINSMKRIGYFYDIDKKLFKKFLSKSNEKFSKYKNFIVSLLNEMSGISNEEIKEYDEYYEYECDKCKVVGSKTESNKYLIKDYNKKLGEYKITRRSNKITISEFKVFSTTPNNILNNVLKSIFVDKKDNNDDSIYVGNVKIIEIFIKKEDVNLNKYFKKRKILYSNQKNILFQLDDIRTGDIFNTFTYINIAYKNENAKDNNGFAITEVKKNNENVKRNNNSVVKRKVFYETKHNLIMAPYKSGGLREPEVELAKLVRAITKKQASLGELLVALDGQVDLLKKI